jgi:flagellin-like protein
MNKIKNNSKALSPVVASIILIAVTVAVSVVVAAWLSGTAFNLMGNSEQAQVTNVAFDFTTGANVLTVSVKNSGGADIAISKLYVNGASITSTNYETSVDGTATTDNGVLVKGEVTDLAIDGLTLAHNTNYEIKITTEKGNNIVFSQQSPA